MTGFVKLAAVFIHSLLKVVGGFPPGKVDD
jgi:hypothetical protein